MALNLAAIRQALVDKAVIGVARSVTGYAYDPGSPALPAIIVRDIDANADSPYHVTFGNGEVDAALELEVLVPMAGDLVTAQKIVDEFRSVGTGATSSIADAVEAGSTTLGGLIENLSCPGSSTPLVFQPENGDPAYISSRFRIDIMANRA